MKIRIGCCGFPVSRKRYYSTFDVVEVQKTFYEPPQLKTVQRWRDSAPEGFEFTLKAWQLITHTPKSPTYRRLRTPVPAGREGNFGSFKPTDEVFEAWRRTREIATLLRTRVVVFQCPASFAPTDGNKKNMKRFFSTIERDGLILVWEPRGAWNEKEIKAVCSELELVHAVDPFKTRASFGKIRYWRLHGIGGYRYRYSREDLEELRGVVAAKESYFMFNNVYMFEDAAAFKALVCGK